MIIINFKEWLLSEMALVSREKLPLDEEDIAYLKQFALKYWPSALRQRYDDLIFKATDHGELRSDWNDNQKIQVRAMGSDIKVFSVNTYMSNLIEKLKNMNYDLTGTNPINKESLFYKPMSKIQATNLIRNLKSTISPENYENYKQKESSIYDFLKNIGSDAEFEAQTIKKATSILDPKPNVIFFTPNHLLGKRNDLEPQKENSFELRQKLNDMWPTIKKIIDTHANNLEKMPHPNAMWWSRPEKRQELEKYYFDYILDNWADEKFHDLKYLKYMIERTRTGNLLQFGARTDNKKNNPDGLISKRKYEKFKKLGVDLYHLLNKQNPKTNKPVTIYDIRSILNSESNDANLYQIFKNMMDYPSIQTIPMPTPKPTANKQYNVFK